MLASLASLLEDGSLGLPPERAAALIRQADDNGSLTVNDLVASGIIGEADLLTQLAEKLGLRYTELEADEIAEEAIRAVTPALTMRYGFMPVSVENGQLCIAVDDPFDVGRLDELGMVLHRRFAICLAARANIQKAVRRHFGVGAATVEGLIAQDKDLQVASDAGREDILDDQAYRDASVISLVNQLLIDAIKERATDIHVEPYEDELRVRYRIDGILHEASMPSRAVHLREAIVNRIKIMASLDIAEKRLPQDGRAQIKIGADEFDLRISVLPSAYGEAVNVRILTRTFLFGSLTDLGYTDQEAQQIGQLVRKPHGMVLVTGPTGSGKTTTLYTCLEQINRPERKILTIEDPVEYHMRGVTQMQVLPSIGFTFARGLRSMFRHDPDVMLVGEIRDSETAEITVRAALTGHLVFSTLHTNDAPGAIPRILDMGIEPYLLASSLEAVVAQRLVRTICPACKQEDNTPFDLAEHSPGSAPPDQQTVVYRGAGCESCRFAGYSGRTAIVSILMMTDRIRALALRRAGSDEIGQAAREEGMTTLAEAGWRKVWDGMTTPEEVWRVAKD